MADKQEDKGFLTKVKEAFIGTPEQNKKAAEEMKAQDKKKPDSAQAKINKLTNYGDYKKGGKVKCMVRGGGIEVRGKTRGKIV
jgi:hypothetical protein